ncbi:hypothetical protein CKO27_04800 [Thiocystis violacea]|nr:hypothetical protein [Thiocystis violacea]
MKPSRFLQAAMCVCVATLLPVVSADAQGERAQRKPDLADVAQGTYGGDVTSDSKGSSRSDVTLTVTRIGENRVRITSDYARLPRVEVPLTQAMETILNASGSTVFVLERSKRPIRLNVTFNNEVSWAGTKP